MAILKDAYEIALYDDVLENGKFVEKRLCVIGTDKMQSQNRAIEPILTTNVNGQKKFSFKMYKRYVDNVTGEEVENLFYGYLVNERKVKLHYKDKWYDFLIKNISETSTNYLYSFELEDALVTELSKNGFNVTLDPESMNNSGTAKELAEYVLQDTDWSVESDVFVQTVEESLVYVTTNKDISGVKWIKDPQGTDEGIDDNTPVKFEANQKLLAFYSSCTDKPHRFQFIKLADYAKDKVSCDANRVITEKDCQYYVDIERPNTPLRNLLNNYDTLNSTSAYEVGRYTFGVTPSVQNQSFSIQLEGKVDDTIVKVDGDEYRLQNLNVFLYDSDSKNIPTEGYIAGSPNFNEYAEKGKTTTHTTFVCSTVPKTAIVYGALAKKIDGKWKIQNEQGGGPREALIEAGIKATVYRIKIEYGTEFTGWAANDSKLPGGVPSEVGQAGYRNKTNGFYLPDGFEVSSYEEDNNNVTVSTWYRGARYGFAQKQTYSPTLDRYVEHYTGGGNDLVYGYTQAKFESPVFNQNLASNYVMQGTGGWKEVNNTENTTNFESRFGKLTKNVDNSYSYTDSIDTLNAGNITDTTFNGYKNYLYVKPANTGTPGDYFIINNGPYDNRTLLSPFSPEDEFLLKVELYTKTNATEEIYSGQFGWSAWSGYCQLKEVKQTVNGYELVTDDTEKEFELSSPLQAVVSGKNYALYKIDSLNKNPNELKKKHQLRIVIEIPRGWGHGYLIGNIEFYKVHRDEQNNIIPPVLDSENEVTVDSGEVEKRHYYFLPEEIEENGAPKVLEKDESINYLFNTPIRDYTTYKPIYNDGAEKVRQVSAKESNYFNILQTIAEKFECWVTLEVGRDAKGGVDNKKVCLRRYAGGDNYAAFRYGVNLKDITRVINSQQIVSKLIVKPNVNEYAEGGVCTIAKAGANPTGETAIYDFGYYHNKGLLDAENYLKTVWKPWSGDMDYVVFRNCTGGLTGENFNNGGGSSSFGPTYSYKTYVNGGGNWKIRNTGNATHFCTDNDGDYSTNTPEKPTGALNDLTGYFPKLKAINNKLLDLTTFRDQKQLEYNEAKAKLDVADAKLSAAIESKLELEEKFEGTYKLGIGELSLYIQESEVGRKYTKGNPYTENDGEEGNVSYTEQGWIDRVVLVATQGSGPSKFEDISECIYEGENDYYAYFRVFVYAKSEDSSSGTTHKDKELKVKIFPKIKIAGKWITLTGELKVKVSTFDSTRQCWWGGASTQDPGLTHDLKERDDVKKLQKEYTKHLGQIGAAEKEKASAESLVNDLQPLLTNYNARIQGLIDLKAALNKTFYQQYSRFIQEGTWVNEEYIDDNKYYADALSTMYNSCYPQVSYTFNVLPISQLPGYEDFNFELGEKTYAEDPEFFGEDENGYPYREEVIIAEKVENLDDPSKHSVKVQNFKNQFQDLFQRITATVQQAQYSTGAYERAAALADAESGQNKKFLDKALEGMANYDLSMGNNPDIVVGAKHITARSKDTSSTLKLVGGAILFGTGEAGEEEWKTGLTAKGIAADLITAGTINTGIINIMNGTDSAFVLNGDGLTGYDYVGTSSSVDSFVRFDKHGIYGISGDGGGFLTEFGQAASKSEKLEKINEHATFALTWDGLKVTGNEGVVARIGKLDGNIINITNNGNSILQVSNNGEAKIATWNFGTPNGAWSNNTSYTYPNSLYTTLTKDGTEYIAFLRIPNAPTGDVFAIRSRTSEGGANITTPFYIQLNGYMHAEKGDIAGWRLSPDSITKDTLGASTGFHMYSTASAEAELFGADEAKNWKLGIGDGFGVTSDGAVYATKGKIGDMEVGQLGNVNKNYILNSDEPVNKQMTYEGTGSDRWIHSYTLSESLPNGTYYLTIKAYTTLKIFAQIPYTDGTYSAFSFQTLSSSAEGTIQTLKVTLTKQTSKTITLWISQDQSTSTTLHDINIKWIKLEATSFSGWSASPLDPWARPNLLKNSGIKHIATNAYKMCTYDFNSSLNSSKKYTLSVNAKITNNNSYAVGDRRYYQINVWRQDKDSSGDWVAKKMIAEIDFSGNFNETVTKTKLYRSALFDNIPSFGSYRLGIYLLYKEYQSDGTWLYINPNNDNTYIESEYKNRNIKNQVEINWIKLEEGYNNTPWCDETGGALPNWSSIGNNFSWQFTENEGVVMQNKVDGKMEDVFRVGKKATDNTYGLWIKGEIESVSTIDINNGLTIESVQYNVYNSLDKNGIICKAKVVDGEEERSVEIVPAEGFGPRMEFNYKGEGLTKRSIGIIYADSLYGLTISSDEDSAIRLNTSDIKILDESNTTFISGYTGQLEYGSTSYRVVKGLIVG